MFDSHKKYRRVGECRQCGRCCDLHCQWLRWVATREIRNGEQFSATGTGEAIMALCLAEPKPEMCAGFPTNPWQTPPKCGYSWVELSNA